jgi:hypothetical protein
MVLAMGPGGLSAGAAADLVPGTIPIVLADRKRVFSVHLRARDDQWIGDLDAAAETIKQRMPRPWQAPDTFGAINIILAEHGSAAPEARQKDLQQRTLSNILGMLLAGIELEPRHAILGAVAECVHQGVCPALVGLIVRRADGALVGVWPLVVALAPYMAAV